MLAGSRERSAAGGRAGTGAGDAGACGPRTRAAGPDTARGTHGDTAPSSPQGARDTPAGAEERQWCRGDGECGHADELGVSGFNPESLAMLNVRISFVKLMDRWRSFGNKKGRGGLLVFIRH